MMHFKYLTTAFIAISVFATAVKSDEIEKRQDYWDNKPSPSIIGNANCKADLTKFARDNPAYMNPPLMAIGDSLFNGVQSLRINWWLSEWSPPSIIAIRMGLIKEIRADRTGDRSFYGPQYPDHHASPEHTRNYGVYLERKSSGFLDNISFALNLARDQHKNLSDLLEYKPDNNRGMVDNISFSGASTRDLLYWTAGDYRQYAMADLASMKSPFGVSPLAAKHIAYAFTNANAAFVLNPTRNSCLETFSPLDHVIARKPRRLLINIGSNNGVYLAGLFGTTIDAPICRGAADKRKSKSGAEACVTPINKFLGTTYEEDMKQIITKLSNIRELEYVYINNLALPSQTANLVPEMHDGKKRYRIAFANRQSGSIDGTVPAKDVADADELVKNANSNLEKLVFEVNRQNVRKGSSQKFVYVDVSQSLAKRDYKSCIFSKKMNCTEIRVEIEKGSYGIPQTQYFDNRPLKASGESGFVTGADFALKVQEGGLFSLDNMHLSSIGYELMAEAIAKEMRKTERTGSPFLPDRCASRNEPKFKKLQEGDCAQLLATVGWSFADATRRNFVFARTVGDGEMRNQSFMKNLLALFQ